MPVALVKAPETESGRKSDHIIILSSPEEEKASLTIHGPTPAMAPAATAPFRRVRRVNVRAALTVALVESLCPETFIFAALYGSCRLITSGSSKIQVKKAEFNEFWP